MRIRLTFLIIALNSCSSSINTGVKTVIDTTEENKNNPINSDSNRVSAISRNSTEKNSSSNLLFRTKENLKVLTSAKYSAGYDVFPLLRLDSTKHKIECSKWHLTNEAIQEILIYLKPAISNEELNTIAIFRECGYRGVCLYNGKKYYYDINSGGWATVGFYEYGLHNFGAWQVNKKFLDTFSISD